MKKILHINPQLEIIWWMERYIEQFYMSFCDIYDIYALSIEKNNINLSIPKDKIFSLNEEINNSIIAKIKKLFFRSRNIAKFCNKNNIDISISHGDIANLFNIISILFWNKSKIIIILHNAFDKNLLWIPLYLLCKFTYKYADEIISVSKELTENTKKQINTSKIKTIYNPFDFEKIEILRKEKIEENIENILINWKINFCHLSRLAKDKNQEYLIECFYNFNKKNSNSQLIIIWDWNEKENLENLIKKLWLENNIFLLWNKQNIYKYLRHINYFLFTWFQEWFWRILIDALSLWIPVLTHDYKYWAKEIIRNNENFTECSDIEIHENGILTPYMDKEKYIEAMQILLETRIDKEKIVLNIKKYSIDNFKKDWNLILR